MKNDIGQVIVRHIQAHASLYLFTFVLFLMGIIFGALIVQSLGYGQREDLFQYFGHFLQEIRHDQIVDNGYAFYHNYFHYFTYIFVIWLLGLSIIGLPLILVLLFLKGIFVGFTVGFLVYQLGWSGFLLALVSIIPQNIIIVPTILFISVVSIAFSLQLIRHLFGNQHLQPKPNMSKYFVRIVVIAILCILVASIQTFISPLMMRLITI